MVKQYLAYNFNLVHYTPVTVILMWDQKGMGQIVFNDIMFTKGLLYARILTNYL